MHNIAYAYTNIDLVYSETGRLMARYCVAFESMKRFLGLKGNETLADLVSTYRHTIHDGMVLYNISGERTVTVSGVY